MGTLSAVRFFFVLGGRGGKKPAAARRSVFNQHLTPPHRRVLSTNAIKDTVSVLYWYEELSSFDWQFLGRIFGSFFCALLKTRTHHSSAACPCLPSRVCSSSRFSDTFVFLFSKTNKQKKAGSSADQRGKPASQHHPQNKANPPATLKSGVRLHGFPLAWPGRFVVNTTPLRTTILG